VEKPKPQPAPQQQAQQNPPQQAQQKPVQEPPSQPAQAQQNPPQEPPSHPAQAQQAPATDKLQSARAAIDARDFDKAVTTLEGLEDANGQRPAETEELLKQARFEQQSKQNLDQAQKEFDAGRIPEGQKLLAAAEGTLAFAPEYSAMKLFGEGYVQLRSKKLPEAESTFRKCTSLYPDYAQCYLMLGVAVARRNRPDEGAQYYREFLRLAPNHEMAASVRKLVADYEKTQKQPGGGK
jgi:tetratricopeptide (TPR) repeat protein